jgi:hypothetical protein
MHLAAIAVATLVPRLAAAQACCAGTGAVTPGRLSLHEDALVGLRLKAANAFGSWLSDGSYADAPSGSTEWDFEEDLFAAVRLAPRAQLAGLIPVVQTYQRTPALTERGGGIGDVNLSGRYDFALAGESRWLPGIAALAGVTFPTGTAVESASGQLATDATGTGAYQANLGVALEQTAGPWLFGASGLVAKRAPRTQNGVKTSKSAEWTLLLATAYTFPGDQALAVLASYAAEGDSEYDGQLVPRSSRRLATLSVAGMFPLGGPWRLQGSAFLTPPVSDLGRSSPASTGLTLTLAWVAARPVICPPSKGDDPTVTLGPTPVAPF